MSEPRHVDSEARSYIVQTKKDLRMNDHFYVKASHWLPEYTPGYKATPQEAILYRLSEIADQIGALTADREKLVELLATTNEETHDDNGVHA